MWEFLVTQIGVLIESVRNIFELVLYVIIVWSIACVGYQFVTWGWNESLALWLVRKVDVTVAKPGVCSIERVQDWHIKGSRSSPESSRDWTVKDVLRLVFALDLCKRLIYISGVLSVILAIIYGIMLPGGAVIPEDEVITMLLLFGFGGIILMGLAVVLKTVTNAHLWAHAARSCKKFLFLVLGW